MAESFNIVELKPSASAIAPVFSAPNGKAALMKAAFVSKMNDAHAPPAINKKHE